MTPRELRKIARAKWGKDWKSPLARFLGKSRVTVWRWNKGSPIKPKDAARIKAMR